MKTKRTLSYLLTATTLISTILPSFAYTYKDSIASEEYHDIEVSTEASNTTVYAEVGSAFKVTIPKHIILDGTTKSGAYTVNVSGDIAGNELVMVVPDDYFKLSSINKLDIYAYIAQDKMSWTYKDMDIIGNGLIETENMTAGSWNGNFNFNIKLESSGELNTNATNSNGEKIKVMVNNIAGVQKEQLLGALVQSGQVSSDEDIDTLLNIDNIEDVDNVEIDTSNVANPGDTVVIIQEKENEWDYISTETVNSNNKVILNAANKTPVSFVQIQPNGTIHVHTYEEEVASAATCNTDGTLLMNCECDKSYSFSIPATHKLEVVEKKDDNGNLINKYYECENCTYSILNLTKLFAGNELSHDCNNYLVSKYDKNKHWKLCSICNKTFNEKQHTITTTWSQGTESCRYDNVYTNTCTNCGFSESGHKPCYWDGISYGSTGGKGNHAKLCMVCGQTIRGVSYYDMTNPNNPVFYANGENSSGLPCTDGNGNRLSCNNPGTCKDCKKPVDNKHQIALVSISENITSDTNNKKTYVRTGILGCLSCGVHLGTMNSEKQAVMLSETSVKNSYIINLKFNKGSNVKFNGINNSLSSDLQNLYSENTTKVTYNTDKTQATVELSYITNGNSKVPVNSWIGASYLSMDGSIGYNGYFHPGNPIPDVTNPTITGDIKITDSNINNGWTTTKSFTVTGTENLSDNVTIEFLDSSDKTIYSGKAVVTNKKYSLTFTPSIEANTSGKTFKIKVTDSCNNVIVKTITIKNTDSIQPSPNLNNTTTTEWSKSKDILFSATDEGSGNLQIAFNNINEYVPMTKNGTLYTKTYQFSGDVYGEIMAAIYYKDEAGNVATQFIKVHNLDNTAPSILNVDRNENILTVSANDLNKELGLEGSRIDSYAITWTSAPPQESDWQESNTFEITKGGTYYLWVRDAVGNVSDSYKIKVLL